MKNILAYTLIVAILASTFHRELGIAYFYSFRDNITEQFCKNIDQPDLNCNGKCYLKEIVLEDSLESHPENPKPLTSRISLIDFQWFFISLALEIPKVELKARHHFFYSNQYSFQAIESISYPPWYS